MNPKPNPQGKGLVPVLDSLAACRVGLNVPAKRIEQISNELFTSLFVLGSEFGFKPVVGQPYWLYRKGERFRLSLVTPAQWGGDGLFGCYVGECRWLADLTWSLALSDEAASDPELMALIARRRRELDQALAAADRVEDVLPAYEASLPFYQRVSAAALAHSLRLSLGKGGLAGLSYRQALALPTPSD